MQTLNDFVDYGHLVLGENSELLNQCILYDSTSILKNVYAHIHSGKIEHLEDIHLNMDSF